MSAFGAFPTSILLPIVGIAVSNLKQSRDNLDRIATTSVVAVTPCSLVRRASTQRRKTDCQELGMHRRHP
jgi:hypothetical protein